MELYLVEKNGRRRKATSVICATCSTSFLIRKGWELDKNYCSYKCRGIANRSSITTICTFCNKSFERKPSAKSKSGLYFCTRKCKDSAQKIQNGLTQIQPPHYGDGRWVYRNTALEHYPHHCHTCGYDKYKELLQVHHIDCDRCNNDLSNLVVLCPTCHWALTIGKATMGSDRIWTWVG